MSTVITGTPGASISATCTGPSAGDAVTAGSVNGPLTSIENDLATIASGSCTIGGTKTFSGTIALGTSGVLTTPNTAASRVELLGRKRLTRARSAVTDANVTLSVLTTDVFSLPAVPAAARTLTLDSTTTVPYDGETISLHWSPTAPGAGVTQYTIKRDAGAGGATIATIVSGSETTAGGVHYHHWATFVYSGGRWVVGPHSSYYDATDSAWSSVVPQTYDV